LKNDKYNKISVIGGGSSGIYAGALLREKFPHATIDLYEKTNSLGGNSKAVRFANREAELCLKLLPSCTLNNDHLYFHEKFQDFLTRYSKLNLIRTVKFIDEDGFIHDSNKTSLEKLIFLYEMVKGFDVLFPMTLCNTASDVLDLGIFRSSESLVEFGKRYKLENFVKWQTATLDILGFDAYKLEAPAYMALYQRCFYSTGFYQKVFLEDRKINKYIKLLVKNNIIKLKYKKEFLSFLDRRSNGGLYTTPEKSINTILKEMAKDSFTSIHLNSEVTELRSIDGGVSFFANGIKENYDLSFLCVP